MCFAPLFVLPLPFAANLFWGVAIASLLNIIKFYSRLPRRSLHILKATIKGVLIVGYYLLVILAPLKNVQRVGMLPMLVGELLFS